MKYEFSKKVNSMEYMASDNVFVIFAQWHFVWACILLLVVVLAFLAVFVLMTVYEVNGSYAAVGEIGMVCKRFLVLAACMVWLIPSIIAIQVYKLEDPKYVADRELWESFSGGKLPWESNREEELTEEERLLFGCFRESQWQQYSGQERITILQKLVDYEAERLGMPTVEISTETLEPSVLGQQGGYGDKIQVDLQHLNTSPVKDVVITCLHESYHAYQSYLVESIDWNAEYTKGIYFQEVRNWRENFSSYIGNGKDFEAYEAQPVEAAARAYAEEEYEFILSMVE